MYVVCKSPTFNEALHYSTLNVIGDQNMQRNDVGFPGTVTLIYYCEKQTNLKSCQVQICMLPKFVFLTCI